MVTISQVQTKEQIDATRELIREYTTWAFTFSDTAVTPPTFEGLEEELQNLPGIYTPPAGRLLLATVDGEPAGCVGLKPHNDTTCEVKRMYVREDFRGRKIGWKLVNMLLDEARKSGYQRIVLDSGIRMKKAHQLYEAVGFKRVKPPDDFPEELKPLAVFMECDLTE